MQIFRPLSQSFRHLPENRHIDSITDSRMITELNGSWSFVFYPRTDWSTAGHVKSLWLTSNLVKPFLIYAKV